MNQESHWAGKRLKGERGRGFPRRAPGPEQVQAGQLQAAALLRAVATLPIKPRSVETRGLDLVSFFLCCPLEKRIQGNPKALEQSALHQRGVSSRETSLGEASWGVSPDGWAWGDPAAR